MSSFIVMSLLCAVKLCISTEESNRLLEIRTQIEVQIVFCHCTFILYLALSGRQL